MEKKSDKDLIKDCLEGNKNAFGQLFEKYWNDLYKIAYRRLASEEDVKDILQEVFISLWNNLHKISGDDNLGGYLYTSLRNKIFNNYAKKHALLKTMMSRPFTPVQSENDIYSSINSKEIQAIVKASVAEMPLKMRQIYLLSKEEQLTNREIAALFAIAPQTVKNQIHQALCRIRGKIKQSSLHLSVFLF